MAEEKRTEITRRGFLTLLGAASAGIAGCNENTVSDILQLAEPESTAPKGPEKWTVTACGQCDAGCSIRVRTIAERAVSLTGNPYFPLNRSGACPRGLSALQALYHPDRIGGPLKRVGGRGEGKWKRIPWDEALGAVAEQLKAIRSAGSPNGLVFLAGECRGVMDAFIARFCAGYGTPNDIRKIHTGSVVQALARYSTQGTYGPIAYDLDNSNYILSFGTPLLDDYVSAARMLRVYGYLRRERGGPKAKLIQIEPRLSVTAAHADQWVPINPGTEAALALGIAYVLIHQDLYDHDFVDKHTFGFEDWQDEAGHNHLGLKNLVLQNFDTDKVAQITGVGVPRILEIAHDFATRRPAIALGEITYGNALYSQTAVHALNALVGSIDVQGGVVFPRELPLKSFAAAQGDEVARRGLQQPRLDRARTRDFPLVSDVTPALIEALAEGKPYAASALFVYYCNPIFSMARPSVVTEALKKIPFIVSFSPYMDETTSHADIVLPDHMSLERWQDVPAPATGPYRMFALRQPVVEPQCDTMHSGDVLIKLAKAVGGSLAAAFPWRNFETALREAVSGIYEAKRGSTVEEFTGAKSWTTALEERGWWYPSYRSFDDFWDQLRQRGGWWDPIYYFGEWQRILQTPSGKFEFYSLTLKRKLENISDVDCLPHYESASFNGAAQEYPFVLNITRLMPHANSRDASLPFLMEILGPHVDMRWDSWVEINPQTAQRLNVADGDVVWVESPAARIRAQARLYPGAMPSVVNMPANLGHQAFGRWSKGIGVNPMELVAGKADRLTGSVALKATRVKIYRA